MLPSRTVAGNHRIDFKRVATDALPLLPAIARRWLPQGCRSGSEWIARNPTRADRRVGSFKINLRTGKWADFATGERGGDVISLAAYLFGLSQVAAARKVADMLGIGTEGRR